MANDKELVKIKLNLFQQIRKKMYLSSIRRNAQKTSKYISLPEILKNDEDIAQAVVNADNGMINTITIGNFDKLISQNPELIKYTKGKRMVRGVNNNKDTIMHLNEGEIEKLFNDEECDKNFMKCVPEDIQYNILCNDALKRLSFGGYPYFDFFSPNVIFKIALDDYNKSEYDRKIVLGCDNGRKALQEKHKLELMLLDNKNMRLFSMDDKEKFIGNNPLLIELLPEDEQEQYINRNQEMLRKMPYNFKRNYIAKYFKYSVKKQDYPDAFRDYFDFDTSKELKKHYIENVADRYSIKRNLNQISQKDNQYLLDMAKFNPDFMRIYDNNNNNFLNVRTFYILQQQIENIIGKENELYKYLDVKNRSLSLRKDFDGGIKLGRLIRFITNDDIIKTVESRDIIDYVEKPSNEKLSKIITQVYGEKAGKIILDRPNAEIYNWNSNYNIPNLYIFHPSIIDEFGIGAIHACLSYESIIGEEFSELARYPDKMEKFKRFNKYTKGMFKDTAEDLNDKFVMFEESIDLFDKIDFEQLNEEQKQGLQLAFQDRLNKSNILDFPQNLEDLSNYKVQRNKIYDEAIQKCTDIKLIRKFISQRYVGLDYEKSANMGSITKANTLCDICKFYNVNNFINNEITMQSSNFSTDDLDALEVLDIIQTIDDTKVLKEIASTLSKREDIINPAYYKELIDKIPLQYSKELVDSLMSPSKAEEMIKNGMSGITVREKDGIKIITLKGIDFTAYVTNPFLNNSNIQAVNSSSNIVDVWKNLEQGVSTISGCIVNQNVHESCIKDIGLGFSDISSNQIVGIGASDIHLTHGKRTLKAQTDYDTIQLKYYYPKQLMKQTAKRVIDGKAIDADSTHPYNEVALWRRNVNLSEIEEGTYGGRLMPDYIYTYGKDSGDKAIYYAKEFGTEYIFEYDPEAYSELHRNYRLTELDKPDEVKKREETSFIEEIKSIAEDKENER